MTDLSEQFAALAPCPNPWCHRTVSVTRTIIGDGGYRVACECGIKPYDWDETEAEAIARWNKRTPSPEIAEALAERDRLAEALAVIAYEQPDEPWRVAHDVLKATAVPLGDSDHG